METAKILYAVAGDYVIRSGALKNRYQSIRPLTYCA